MQINSIPFLFCFLPLFCAAYYLSQGKLRPVVLSLGSILFYIFAVNGNLLAVGMLMGSVLAVYAAGIVLSKTKSGLLLAISLSGMLLVLSTLKLFRGGRFLAAGMSFYLFQEAAYLIDLWRGRAEAETDFLDFSSQILMFPKLLSGPLVLPAELQRQNREIGVSSEKFRIGLEEFVLGLFLKVFLASRLGGLWMDAKVAGLSCLSVPLSWMALAAFSLQLYFDFYGYSLMAVGLGRMLGYDLPQNFLTPYASRSVSEFYRRWHASLGVWFREYIYIPLGGNRRGTGRTLFNLAVVWLLTGLWHGVGGNYLLWAAFIYTCIAAERLFLGKYLKKTKMICHIYLVFVILLSWIPFAVKDPCQVFRFFGRLFGFGGAAVNPSDYMIYGRKYIGVLVVGVLCASPLLNWLWDRIRKSWASDFVLLAVFWFSVYLIATAAQDPFLYFAF